MPESTVTVIVTSFNDGRFLHESVGSAVDLAATDPERVDVLVADDGSTERRTVDVLDRLEREGVNVMRLPHRGLSATRNAALAEIASAWFVPLDADNRLRSSMVAQLLPVALASTSAAMVYGDAMRFGLRTGLWKMGPTDPQRLRVTNHIDSCALIRRSAWSAVGGYDEQRSALEDWYLWLRFLDAGFTLEYVEGITFDYRERPNSLYRQRLVLDAIGR